MKHSALLLVIFAITFIGCNLSFGQEVNYDQVIAPTVTPEDDVREKLVRLAWVNHPLNNVAKRQIDIATYDLKLSRREWFDVVLAQGNVNEFNIDPSRDVEDRAQFFPRYNVSARISLGMFFTIPLNTKKSRESVGIAIDEVNALKLNIREEVIKSYNNYLMFEKIYQILSQSYQDAESTHLIQEESFKSNEISYDVYMSSLNNLNRLQIEVIKAETDYINSQATLESLIGVPLEEVL